MIHGLVASGKNWDMNLPALAATRTVYAIDLANMGQSERVADLDAGLVAHADRLVALLDALQIERADLIAQSHGGAISMMVAARYPERVRSMVLFSPANPFCQRGRRLMAFYMSRVGRRFAKMIPQFPMFSKRLAFARVYVDPSKVTALARQGYLNSLTNESIAHVLNIVRAWWPDMALLREHLAAAAKVPTLLIWGDRDTVVGLESAHQLADVLGAELLVVPRAGHLPFAEQPEMCNRATLEFLARPA